MISKTARSTWKNVLDMKREFKLSLKFDCETFVSLVDISQVMQDRRSKLM
jgi:hypothetical protein